MTKFIRTTKLEICYEEYGPTNGKPLILLHGWPDSPRTWDALAPGLCDAGFHCFAPFLRGFGQTRFLDASDVKSD